MTSRIAIPFLFFGLALVACMPSSEVEERAQGLSAAATVWTNPTLLRYRTVIPGSEQHAEHPTFTVFIELSDGSAGAIDPASVRLNGFPALPEPRKVVDNNENGVPDLKLKFDRSVFDGNVEGVFEISGLTASGSFTAGGSVPICTVENIERTTYTIPYVTANMPDPTFNGQAAEIEVRRVRPVFGRPSARACSRAQALVMVHGRTIEATATFDLQYKDYSLMEDLAQRGIDTFAVNLLGFGRSRLVDEYASTNPLANACNASLPQLPGCPAGPSCTSIPGVCDCQGVPPSVNQQGVNLTPNPLSGPCPHTSPTWFQTIDNQVADLDRVVNDVKAKTGGRVSLLGYSAGGITAGVYLADPTRQAKIERAIFMASLFAIPETIPPFPNWPLGVTNRTSVGGGFNLDPTSCPGQQDPAIVDTIWAAMKAREPVDAPWKTWGQAPETAAGGVNRFPIVGRAGWTTTASQQISIPILAMNGLRDSVVPVASTVAIYRNSPQANSCTTNADCASGYTCETTFSPAVCRLDNRTLVQLPCASHSLVWESCTGTNCLDPHNQVKKLIGDYVLTGRILASP